MKATIIAPNEPDPDHLEIVVEIMKIRGAPRLRVFRDGSVWLALEGSHRLRAAAHLQFPVILVPYTLGERITTDVLHGRASVKRIVEELKAWHGCPSYTLEAEIVSRRAAR